MFHRDQQTFQAYKANPKVPIDKVIGSRDNLSAKMLSLFYLESKAGQFARVTGIDCYVPPFVGIRTGEVLREFCPSKLVSKLSLNLLRDPLQQIPGAEGELKQALENGYNALSSRLSPTAEIFIRSAGQYEDGQKLSFAGVYDSVKVPAGDKFAKFIEIGQKVALSPYQPKALRYQYWNNVPVAPIDVIAQEHVRNAVKLNFTVTRDGIESVGLLSGDSGVSQKRKIFKPSENELVDTITGKRLFNEAQLARQLSELCEKLSRSFEAEVIGDGRISIECAFDSTEVLDNTCPKKLAFLQIRPLPAPVSISQERITKEIQFPLHTHIIPGPCTFDSVVVVKISAMTSPYIGVELCAVARNLHEMGKSRPLLILEGGLTSSAVSGYSQLRLEMLAELPFVGIVDLGRHNDRFSYNARGVFAGHVGALINERVGLLVNQHNFEGQLRSITRPEETIQGGLPVAELESLLASDLAECTLLDNEIGNEIGADLRTTQAYLLPTPMTASVIHNPEHNPYYKVDDSPEFMLKLTL
jgi:hypothetical protein